MTTQSHDSFEHPTSDPWQAQRMARLASDVTAACRQEFHDCCTACPCRCHDLFRIREMCVDQLDSSELPVLQALEREHTIGTHNADRLAGTLNHIIDVIDGYALAPVDAGEPRPPAGAPLHPDPIAQSEEARR